VLWGAVSIAQRKWDVVPEEVADAWLGRRGQ